MTAIAIRNMIHESEIAARDSRDLTVDRERALATQACDALWAVRSDADDVASLRRLVSCARRLASLSFQRWAGLLIALEKIFHKSA